MEFVGILLFFLIVSGLYAQTQDYETPQTKTLSAPHKTQLRALASGQCMAGTLDTNGQCICQDGYFDETCGTLAKRLVLNDFSYAPLQKGQHYFYIDLTDQDTDLTLTFEFLPKFVHIDLAFTNLKNYLLPKNSIFAFYDSPDKKALWEIPVSLKDLPSINRLFVFVNVQEEQELNKNFKIKITEGSSSTLTIVLIVVGTISIILNIVGCVYFIKYKLRREVEAALRQQLERDNLFSNNFPHNIDRNRHRVNLDPDAALTQEDLNLYFPESTFEQLKTSFSQLECPICLEEFKPDAVCRQLYCEHIFHNQCIQFWLAKQKACPTCKKSMSRKAIADYYTTFKKEEKAILLHPTEHEIEGKMEPLREIPIGIAIEASEEAANINTDKAEELNEN